MNFYLQQCLLLNFLWFTWFASAQCNQPEIVYTICDITALPGPHGDLHLNTIYTNETGNPIPVGSKWEAELEIRFTLEKDTDIVRVWDLRDYSTSLNQNDYTYTLTNSSCTDNEVVKVRLIIAPFPGEALPPFGDFNINLEVCDTDEFDLFSSLAKDDSTPSPHKNGEWFELSGDGGVELGIVDNMQSVKVNYVSVDDGGPLIDQVQKYYRYKVNSDLGGCFTAQSTDVAVSVVRQVQSGTATNYSICESEFKDLTNSSLFNKGEINLRDDLFLRDEDEEGNWEPDLDMQIADIDDSSVDIFQVYQKRVMNNPDTHRFDPIQLNYTYVVPQRSGVCDDFQTTTITFTIFESLRPFEQNTSVNNVFCEEGDIKEIDLFSLIKFTSETRTNGTIDDFIYPNNSAFTTWEYIEGPLDIEGEKQEITDTDLESSGIFSFLTPDPSDPDTNFILPGTYKFEYTVDSWINANAIYEACEIGALFGSICDRACTQQKVEIIVEIIPLNYAGENTISTLCSNVGIVNLTDMLISESETRSVSRTGVWRDSSNTIVSENFLVPDIPTVDGDRQYNFTYTTTTPEGCSDTSNLTLNVTKSPYAGSNVAFDICTDDLSVVLYDLVNNDSGNIADPTGSWVGPNGYRSVDHTGTFEDGNIALPVLQPGIYTYTVEGKDACTGEVSTSQVIVNFIEPLQVTGRFDQEVCKLTGKTTFNLFNFLDVSASLSGTFTAVDDKGADLPSLQALIDTNGVLDYTSLSGGTYHFRYDVTATAPCADKSQPMTLKIFDESSFPRPGIGTPLTVCSNGRDLVLFDQLTSAAGEIIQDDGIWTGPFDYVSTDNQGTFVEGDPNLPVLQEGIYTYTVKGQGPCGVVELTSQVRVSFSTPFFLGNDFQEDFCIKDIKVDLFELLDRATVRTGVFVSTQSDVDLSDEGVFTFTEAGIFEFLYIVNNAAPCTDSQLRVTINVKEVEIPENPIDTYCILDAVHLSDVEIPLDQKWYLTELEEEPYTQNPLLKNGMTFYLEKEEFGCTSDRLPVEFTILNVGQKDEAGIVKHCTIDFQEAVTPNNDGTNDTFRVNTAEDSVLSDRIMERMDENSIWKGKYFNLELPFPNYELQIFNRYGALVFEGNSRTAEFRGEGNQVGQQNGALPTGVYFYIFNPNYENHQPIQGSFYLSK